jgi:hypothetical protein
MRATATFDIGRPRDEVVAYLSNARNILIANREGRVVERSEPPVGAGSWSVLAFDQIRVLVEYTELELPTVIAVSLTYTGRGSGGMYGTFVYRLAPADNAGGTRVTIEAEGSGGPIPERVSRLLWPLMWRRLRSRMQSGNGASP